MPTFDIVECNHRVVASWYQWRVPKRVHQPIVRPAGCISSRLSRRGFFAANRQMAGPGRPGLLAAEAAVKLEAFIRGGRIIVIEFGTYQP
jgi:hypothetical protein